MDIKEAKRIASLLGYEELKIFIDEKNQLHLKPFSLELTEDADIITLLHELGHRESDESETSLPFGQALYYIAICGMIMETKPESIETLPPPQVLIEAINQAIKCEVEAWLNALSFIVCLKILGEQLPEDLAQKIRKQATEALNSYLEHDLMSEGAFDQLPAVQAARILMDVNNPEAESQAWITLLKPAPQLRMNEWIMKGDLTE